MPFYSRSNNWASKLVIVLQFTAWISVGIVLLQKGVTSLRSQAAIEEKANVQATNDAMVRYLNEKTKRTVKQRDSASDKPSYDKEEHLATDDEDDKKKLELPATRENLSTRRWNRRSSIDEDESDKDGSTLVENNEETSSDEYRLCKESNEEESKQLTRVKESDPFDLNETSTYRDVHRVDSSSRSNKTRADDRSNTIADSAKRQSFLKETSSLTGWHEEKKLRTRLNTGGAAAAIAMVAVGAAMLVVGPIVIVLRTLDKRRQERRYLKSSTWDDQPPTYEQATLMNEAPRYSTLNLNAVHTSRASTLPARSTVATSHERSPPG